MANDSASSPGSEKSAGGPSHLVQHLDAAYNLARWLLRNHAEAEDAVQDAFVRAIHHFAGYRGGDSKAWLLAIVRNQCYDRLRAKGIREHADFDEAVHTPGAGPANPEALVLRGERSQALRQALDALPAEYREVVVLRELEQFSYQEIAEIAGIPIGTVMSRLSRARRRLQEMLAPRLP